MGYLVDIYLVDIYQVPPLYRGCWGYLVDGVGQQISSPHAGRYIYQDDFAADNRLKRARSYISPWSSDQFNSVNLWVPVAATS